MKTLLKRTRGDRAARIEETSGLLWVVTSTILGEDTTVDRRRPADTEEEALHAAETWLAGAEGDDE